MIRDIHDQGQIRDHGHALIHIMYHYPAHALNTHKYIHFAPHSSDFVHFQHPLTMIDLLSFIIIHLIFSINWNLLKFSE